MNTRHRLLRLDRALLIFAGMAFSASTVWAGVNVWTTNGPNGTKVRALAIDPANPATIYAAATYAGGVFKSTDGGGSWTTINTGLTNAVVVALVIDPSTPVILYSGTHAGGVFRSVNGGASWINTGLIGGDVRALVIDPLNPTTLYAGVFGSGVYKSTDSGGTWAVANTGLGSPYVEVLAINPATPATLYAGTVGPQVFKSTDAGGTWSQTGEGPNHPWVSGHCFALAIDPAAPTTVYAGTDDGVDYGFFKSADGGSSWTFVNFPYLGVLALAIDPSTPTTLYAGTWGGGVFKSVNGGASWTSTNAGLTTFMGISSRGGGAMNDVRSSMMIQKMLRASFLLAGVAFLVTPIASADGPFSFFPLTPCRVIDTRGPVGPNGGPSLAANTIRNFPIINVNGCGVPNTAKAVAFNFTTVAPTEGGDLRIWPYNSPVPLASVINFSGLDFALANGAIIGVANISGLDVSVQTDMAPALGGSVHLVVDVTGYFQ